jgi:hypothetical protein
MRVGSSGVRSSGIGRSGGVGSAGSRSFADGRLGGIGSLGIRFRGSGSLRSLVGRPIGGLILSCALVFTRGGRGRRLLAASRASGDRINSVNPLLTVFGRGSGQSTVLFFLVSGQLNPELLFLVTSFGNFDSGKWDHFRLSVLLLGVVELFFGDFEGEITRSNFLSEDTLAVLEIGEKLYK